jgi:hypothetical protein
MQQDDPVKVIEVNVQISRKKIAVPFARTFSKKATI